MKSSTLDVTITWASPVTAAAGGVLGRTAHLVNDVVLDGKPRVREHGPQGGDRSQSRIVPLGRGAPSPEQLAWEDLSVAHDELLRIDYNLERVLTGEPDDNQLDVWAAALTRGTFRDDDTTWQEAATATLYGLDPQRNTLLGESPFDVADAYSADAAYYYEHVFEASGELLADVQDEFEWVDARALFLHDVQVPGPLRRRGYGSLLAADAILTLAPHGTAVFAHPGPTDLQSEDPEDVPTTSRDREHTVPGGAGLRATP
jgi:hypothetical protein